MALHINTGLIETNVILLMIMENKLSVLLVFLMMFIR